MSEFKVTAVSTYTHFVHTKQIVGPNISEFVQGSYDGNYDGHGISSALDWLAGQTVQETARYISQSSGTPSEWFPVKKEVRQGCVLSL